jgi:general secretion pathway protein H
MSKFCRLALTVHRAVTVKTLTLRTKTEMAMPWPPVKVQRGFTLIELLVVLAIASLLVGLAPVAYSTARESAQYRTTLRTMTADMRQARQQAIAQSIPVTFQIDLQNRQQGIVGRPFQTWPAELRIQATVGQNQIQQGTAAIVFLPGGGATGGSIEILRSNGTGTRLRVDWFSGLITQERLLP